MDLIKYMTLTQNDRTALSGHFEWLTSFRSIR